MASEMKTASGRTIKRTVTPATLSMEVGKPCVFKVLKPMFKGEKREGDKKKEPPTILEVEFLDGDYPNLRKGAVCHTVLGTALEGRIRDTYADETYVGLTFEVTKLEERQSASGNTFYPYEVYEV